MRLKKILKILVIVFVALYVMRRPDSAASTLRAAGETAYHGILTLADSAAKFFDALLKR